eukprot:6432-Rhodomonas_salina.2
MSGTLIAYGPQLGDVRYCFSVWDHAMSGTDLAVCCYRPTRPLGDARSAVQSYGFLYYKTTVQNCGFLYRIPRSTLSTSIPVCARYAKSGTDYAYGAAPAAGSNRRASAEDNGHAGPRARDCQQQVNGHHRLPQPGGPPPAASAPAT